MGRGPKQKQMGVSLPDALRAQLDAAAAASGRSVAEEIRNRVEKTFAEDALDPALRGLIADLTEFAWLVELDTLDAWNEDAAVHAVFRAGALALIDDLKPPGSPAFTTRAARQLFGTGISDSDDPETIGRALARHLKRVKQERLRQQKGEGG